MKGLITVFLLSLPATSQAMGMRRGAGDCSGDLMITALFAAIAAMGYWVLQHADKENSIRVKRTGQTVGAALVILGLLGLLCGVAHHLKTAMAQAGRCGGSDPGSAGMMREMPMPPPGHRQAGMMKEMPMLPPGQPPDKQTKKPETGARKNSKGL